MDNLVMLVFLMLGIAGYVRLIRERSAGLPLKILAVVAIVFVLLPFTAVTLGRIDSQWWSGNARVGWWMISVMATGFVCLVRERERAGHA